MFKGFIPGHAKRVASVDLAKAADSGHPTALNGLEKENLPRNAQPFNHSNQSAIFGDNNEKNLVTNKENAPKDKKEAKAAKKTVPATVRIKSNVMESVEMRAEFEKMLDDLQIPTSLRPKLETMDAAVKAAMIRSSQTITQLPQKGAASGALNKSMSGTPALRRTRSIDSISLSMNSPRPSASLPYEFPTPPHTPTTAARATFLANAPANISGPLEPPVAPFMNLPNGSGFSLLSGSSLTGSSGHTRSGSLDLPRSSSQSHLTLGLVQSSTSEPHEGTKSKKSHYVKKANKEKEKEKTKTKDKEKEKRKSTSGSAYPKEIDPSRFCIAFRSTSSTVLDIDLVKKLRLCLRNEPASWTETFIRLGGYENLLTRLNELLEVEWREEQHDDQLLHELLRCFKALSTSAIGCSALRSSCPTPYTQLVSLLYSDKKPGDIGSRQLIVELLLVLFELYPTDAPHTQQASSRAVLPSGVEIGVGGVPYMRRREVWEDGEDERPPSLGSSVSSLPKPLNLPYPHTSLFTLVRSLLLTPAPAPSEGPTSTVSPHEFIESLRIPRIYKAYLQELSDVCRDYFWVFCHPGNTLWSLDDVDEGRVEKPRAPGGMTGGVEFEAMGYLTMHFKFINALAKAAAELNLPKEHEHSAHRLHADLFASHIERIILVARKASTMYYPTLHLEISRYIAFAGRARYELPWTLSRYIGPPPSAMSKSGKSSASHSQNRSGHSTPTKRSVTPAGPRLPTPVKTEPLKL